MHTYYYYYLLRVWMGEHYLGARGGGFLGEKIRCLAWLGCCISLVGMGALDARKEGFGNGEFVFIMRDERRGGGEGTGGYLV